MSFVILSLGSILGILECMFTACIESVFDAAYEIFLHICIFVVHHDNHNDAHTPNPILR